MVGANAARIAAGMGADVTVVDRNPDVLRRIDNTLSGVHTVFSTRDAVETLCRRADLIIATVLIPGATAPKLITAETVRAMKPGAVIVDVSIDQGGCAETSRPTTHSHPTYIVDDVVHYCVANMPGAVARTSTFALNNMTLPHAQHPRGAGHLPGGRRGVEAAIRAGGAGVADVATSSSFRAACSAREPGIHNHRWEWNGELLGYIPGSRKSAPRNDDVCFDGSPLTHSSA